MVMSIDYLWVYDPAVSLCILKSTQIIGSTNFVFRVSSSKIPPRRSEDRRGSEEIIATGNEGAAVSLN